MPNKNKKIIKKNKETKDETIDERLFRECGVTPVPKDHPIYSRGVSIRFLKKIKKGKDNEQKWIQE